MATLRVALKFDSVVGLIRERVETKRNERDRSIIESNAKDKVIESCATARVFCDGEVVATLYEVVERVTKLVYVRTLCTSNSPTRYQSNTHLRVAKELQEEQRVPVITSTELAEVFIETPQPKINKEKRSLLYKRATRMKIKRETMKEYLRAATRIAKEINKASKELEH
ncbi:unnamed protein product [Dovyalis caffra]|uniref:Uncharacterized protein n=1 Tax=Dovyalis caffra TaxID=77055 RepID=A0AAV1REJ4_9ROSI|nr:unnamed protein product [Dovyalis caffra]